MANDVASDATADRIAIRNVVEAWALARDSANWDWFREQWHDDGCMWATWFQGPASKFIEVSRAGFDSGVSILHFLGGFTVDIAGNRAVAQTKTTISQRGMLEGTEVEVLCTGRFYDFFEKRAGRWGIVLRQPIYEKDRMDPVQPGATVELEQDLLARFPEGYRYLAYLQVLVGYPVKPDMPGLRGPGVEALYARGAAWLAGEPVAP